MKYVCELCGMIYDEDTGDSKRGIPAGTAFGALPQTYECPGCGSEKEAFSRVERQTRTAAPKEGDRAFWENVKYSEYQHDSER